MEGKRYRNRTTEICQIPAKDECRFAYGVQNLVALRSEKFEEGYSYHILTDGKVDMLNHLRWLIMLYGRIDEVYLSSWSINATNILMLERWHDAGELGDVNLIVGEIFPAKFKEEWKTIVKLRDKGVIARLFTGRIHAKIILARAASGEEIVVETSANANMNPRCEQSAVSVSSVLFDFYKSYFDVKFVEYVRKQSVKELMLERLDYEVIIVRGLPYSDRTIEAKRLAKKKKTVRISFTDIMHVIGGCVDDETCMRMAYNAAWQAIRTAFVRGYSVVLDEVNLGEAGVQPFIVLANEKGASVEYVTVRTPVEECVRRARECDGDVEVVRYYHGLYYALLEE